MSKKKQELSPDTVLKNYWNNNEQFADLLDWRAKSTFTTQCQ